MVEAGETPSEPLVVFAPVHPPEAVQVGVGLAFELVLHERVDDEPLVIEVGLAVNVRVGATVLGGDVGLGLGVGVGVGVGVGLVFTVPLVPVAGVCVDVPDGVVVSVVVAVVLSSFLDASTDCGVSFVSTFPFNVEAVVFVLLACLFSFTKTDSGTSRPATSTKSVAPPVRISVHLTNCLIMTLKTPLNVFYYSGHLFS